MQATAQPLILPEKIGKAVTDLPRELHRDGTTVCMVTHDPRYARHADRVVRMLGGKLGEESRPSPRAVAADGGVAARA